ncbi:MAG TPA: hypothetical protein VFE37_01005 [Chloroflexota bacterium]|nr:hypothetical protein [Chloroflexota bacterium]
MNQAKSIDTPGRRLLDRLIRQQPQIGPKRYGLFWVTGEGRYLPSPSGADRIEQTSGYVVAAPGTVFAFWLGWDADQQQPALTRWRRVSPGADWASDPEYQEARAEAGLPAE